MYFFGFPRKSSLHSSEITKLLSGTESINQVFSTSRPVLWNSWIWWLILKVTLWISLRTHHLEYWRKKKKKRPLKWNRGQLQQARPAFGELPSDITVTMIWSPLVSSKTPTIASCSSVFVPLVGFRGQAHIRETCQNYDGGRHNEL